MIVLKNFIMPWVGPLEAQRRRVIGLLEHRMSQRAVANLESVIQGLVSKTYAGI